MYPALWPYDSVKAVKGARKENKLIDHGTWSHDPDRRRVAMIAWMFMDTWKCIEANSGSLTLETAGL